MIYYNYIIDNRYIHVWHTHTQTHTSIIHPNITKKYKVYKMKSNTFLSSLSDSIPTIYSVSFIYSAFSYKDSYLHLCKQICNKFCYTNKS